MMRRLFLALLAAAAVSGKKHDLDQLIADYNRRFEDVRYAGHAVIYERETWDGVRQAFSKIIAACYREGVQDGLRRVSAAANK